jgi:hypothetical protein
MKSKNTLFFSVSFILLWNCQGSNNLSERVYEGFLEAHYLAYNKAHKEVDRNSVNIEYNIGDTLYLTEEAVLIPVTAGFTFQLGDSVLKFPSLQPVVISGYSGLFEVTSVNDPKKTGFISKRELEYKTFGGISIEQKVNFYEAFENAKRKYIDSVKMQYDLSDQDYWDLLLREHVKRTGQHYMAY